MRNHLPLALILLAAAIVPAQDGVISGIVRDASTRAPLAGANVSIQGNGVKGTGVTDVAGEFRVEGLPPGNYSVRSSMDGYLAQSASAEVGQAGRRALQRRVVIDLVPVSTIEGTVFDEDGKAMAGVSLYTGASLQGTTDAEGHFRIENLPPANYRIDVRIPLALRKQTLKRNQESGEAFGYPNTEYYPGTADIQAAVRVSVTGGLRLRGLDIRLRRVPLVDLAGRIIERAGGEPLATAHVELAANFAAMPDETFAVRPVDDTGAFRFEAIQPGSYSLLVYRGDPDSVIPYLHAIEVGGAGIADLSVRVPPFQRLEGVVRTASDDIEWTGQLVISLMPVQRGVQSRRLSVTTKEFALDWLPPGRYSLVVQSGAELKSSHRKLVVGVFRLGTQDLSASPAAVSESGNPPLEIWLSADTGRLAVKVFAADGAPDQGRVIVRRSGNASLESMMSSIYSLDLNGAVTIGDLAPGSYEVSLLNAAPIAVGIAPPSAPTAKVEVKAGETAVAELHFRENR